MAIGMFCIPTIREEIVGLRQADIVREVDERQLELLALELLEHEPPAPVDREAAKTRVSHRHWPMRPVHTH